jgi:hypothetical protein
MSDTSLGLDAEQLLVGTALGPGLWIAPYPTVPPGNDEDFGGQWVSLGYASEDGPTVSSSTDTTDMRAWQSLAPLRSVITGRTVTIGFQLLQWNAVNLGLYWDVDTPVIAADGTFRFDVRSDQAGARHTIGLDVEDGPNRIRMIFPRVQLNATGDMQFQRGSLAVLDVTFAALETEGTLLTVLGRIPSAADENRPPRGITHIDPPQGAAGDRVTIWGSGLSGSTAVEFGVTPVDPATIDIHSDEDLVCTVPANPGGPGPVKVTVRNPAGDMEYSSPPGWTYTVLQQQAARAPQRPTRGGSD